MDNLPVEIKEMIIYFCDGETLYHLSQLNRQWKILIDQEDKRRSLYKQCLKKEIDKEILKDLVTKMYPKKTYLYSNPRFFKGVYCASLRWKYLSNSGFKIKKLPHKFSDIIDLKISGNTLLVGDKCGLYVINSLDCSSIFYDLGRVKNIELFCIKSKSINKNYEYDGADIITENKIHHFYDLWGKTITKTTNYHEKKFIKYYNKKSIEFDMDDYITADFHEDYVMMVTANNVIQAKDSSLFNVHKTPFDFQGARAWCCWHSKLIICSKDESLCIFANGKTRTIYYHGFPPITAVHYYAGWLLLGSRYGLLYGYRLLYKSIHLLDLNKFQVKKTICGTAIVRINVIQKDKLLRIIVASDKEIFSLCDVKERHR